MICNNLHSAFLPKSVKFCINNFPTLSFLWHSLTGKGARAMDQEEGDKEKEEYKRQKK